MKAETVVDLFQFIKAARVQRAGMVLNKVCFFHTESDHLPLLPLLPKIIQDQYEFGHQVLADFLDGFDTYANFKELI